MKQMNGRTAILNNNCIDYTTKEGMQYYVYDADVITVDDIANAIEDSDYFDAAYKYAKERMKQEDKITRAQQRMAASGFDKYSIAAYHACQSERQNLISSIGAGFDIEFTRVEDKNDDGEILDARSYMYHWQFGVNDLIITGRTWAHFQSFFEKFRVAVYNELKEAMKRKGKRWGWKNHPHVIIWIANLPCEFQFIKDLLNFDDLFAKDSRKPVYASIASNSTTGKHLDRPYIVFQDCLQITGGSLEKLAEDYTTTKKRKGDLDYEVMRNSLTPLSADELCYCYDDVAILTEWHEYYYNTYKAEGYAPMTITGILRHAVKAGQTEADLFNVWRMFPEKTPVNNEYEYVMNWVFKGGYAHGNLRNIDLEFDNVVYSWDITSSYPYVMLTCLYPMGKFQYCQSLENNLNSLASDPKALHDYIDVTCRNKLLFYAEVEIICPVAKTCNTYISLSKTINKTEIESLCNNRNTADRFPVSIIDNGRIMRTYRTVTAETDLDILTILEMYNYAQIRFSHVMACFKLEKLPKYVTDPIEQAYENKSKLKKAGKAGTVEYKISKSKVNSGYGMMCTRLIINDVIYDSTKHSWVTVQLEDNRTNLEEQLFLNPMWGIWVTAYARRRLMKMVVTAGDDSIVCDTDSIYAKKSDKLVKAIEAENARVLAENKIRFNNNPHFDDLGCWDKQSVNDKKEHVPYERFATMGAKRYVLYGWNDGHYGWKQTIAGLPKKTLEKFCKKYNSADNKATVDPQHVFNNKNTIDLMDVFLGRKGFGLTYTDSDKKTTIYHDTAHSDVVTDAYGNSEVMTELSSVSIVPIQFRMTINALFIMAMDWLISQNSNAKTERRTL